MGNCASSHGQESKAERAREKKGKKPGAQTTTKAGQADSQRSAVMMSSGQQQQQQPQGSSREMVEVSARGKRPGGVQHILQAVVSGDRQMSDSTPVDGAPGGVSTRRSAHQTVDLQQHGGDATGAVISNSDEWLGDLIDVLWPFVRAAANAEACGIAGPVLENVPPFVANVLIPGLGKIVAVPIHGISAAIRLLDVMGPAPPLIHVTSVYQAECGSTCLEWRIRWPLQGAVALTVTPSKDETAANAALLNQATKRTLATSEQSSADLPMPGGSVPLSSPTLSRGTTMASGSVPLTSQALKGVMLDAEEFYDARSRGGSSFKSALDDDPQMDVYKGRGLAIGEWAAIGPEQPPVEQLQGSIQAIQSKSAEQLKQQPAGTILASVAIESALDITGTVTVSLQSLADALAASMTPPADATGASGGGSKVPSGRNKAGVKLPPEAPQLVDFSKLQDKSWFNQLLICLWPQLRQLAVPFLAEIAPKFITPFKPYWIADVRLGKMDLGSAPPFIRSVVIFQDEHDVTPDLMMDLDLEWHTQDMLAEIMVQTMSNKMRLLPERVSKAISGLMTFRGGINDFWLKAKVRIMLRPLLERLPVLGAMQVAFVELPEFGMDLTCYGGEMWMLNPIKSFFFNIIRDAVLGQYVFPDALSVPIDQTVRPINPPEGLLEVTVLEARNVPRMDWWPGSVADMFVELWVSKTSKQRTKVVSGSRSPVFGEKYAFPVHIIKKQECKIICWDVDPLSNEEMGRVAIELGSLEEGTADIWVEVPYKSDEASSARNESKWPIAKIVGEDCKKFMLHLRLTWDEFDSEEIGTIVQAQMHGPLRVLMTAAGRSLPEPVQCFLLQGSLKIIVEAARRMGVPAKSRVFCNVAVPGCKEERITARSVPEEEGGTVATFAKYLQFDLDLNTLCMGDEAVISFTDAQGNQLGGLSLPLHELLDHNMAGWRPLDNAALPEAEVMLFTSWTGFFD